jgi:hypothetical protein
MQNWRRWRDEDHPRNPKKGWGLEIDLYLRIENPPFMPLVIEAVDESGPCGLPALSVAHYGEQNGDLMRDPEMCFELGYAAGVCHPARSLLEAVTRYGALDL